jgi:hypothetical protein
MHFFSSNVAPNEYVHRICVWETHAKFDIRAYYKLYFLWFCHLWMKFFFHCDVVKSTNSIQFHGKRGQKSYTHSTLLGDADLW